MEAKHTATPWKPTVSEMDSITIRAEGNGLPIAEIWHNRDTKANADFIVRACNAHDDLINELQAAEKIILAMLRVMMLEQKQLAHDELILAGVSTDGMTRYHERRAALAKAKGEPA